MKRMFALFVAVLLSLAHSEHGLAQNNNGRFRVSANQAISILQYGANGTDTASDGAAIQAALTAAGSAAANGTPAAVYVPAGTYYTTTTLSIPANVTLIGDGPGASIIKLATNSAETLTPINTDLLVPTSYNPIVVPSQTGGPHAGIVIRDLKIDGNTANQAGQSTAEGTAGVNVGYAGISTQNSIGMVIDNVAVVDVMASLNITGSTTPRRAFCLFVYGKSPTPIDIPTTATWTNASATITQSLGFGTAVQGMRVRFSAGTGVLLGQDFYVTSKTSNTLVLSGDINGASGDIGSGTIAGKVYDDRDTNALICAYAKVTNSYFDNAGYDCVSVRGVGTRNTEITNCTILRGQQSSFQTYDRAPHTHVSNCMIDNRGSAGTVGAGVLSHASRSLKLTNCTVKCDTAGAAINAFGDNNNGYSELAPNNCEDFTAENCYFEYTGTTTGIAAADFNGASGGYLYSVRPTFNGCTFVVNVPTSTNNACAIVGSGMIYGLVFNGCNFLSNSNEACINLGQSKDIVVQGCTIRNTYSGGFNGASCYFVNAGDPAGPQGYILSNSVLCLEDVDSTAISVQNSNGVSITNNSIFHTNATQATGTGCLLNDADNTNVIGNLFCFGTTGSVFDVDNSGGAPDNITIAYNTVMRGRNNSTQPTRGITCDNTATKVHILENDFSRCVTNSFGATFSPSTGSVVRGNKANSTQGITENKLTGALTAGAATINHNLTAWRTLTPGDVVVQSNGSAIRCTAVSSTQITLAGTGTDTYYVTIRANEF